LRYLKNTTDLGITLGHDGEGSPQLAGSCDASFAGDTDFRFSHKTGLYIGGAKSHSGYIFWYGDSPLIWKSFRQGRVALSSTEAEIIALVGATTELCWLRDLIEWLQPGSLKGPTPMEQDNTSAIHLVDKKTLTKRSKHYHKDYFFVTDKVEMGLITLRKQDTKLITSDLLTKALQRQDFYRHLNKLMANPEGTEIQSTRTSEAIQKPEEAEVQCTRVPEENLIAEDMYTALITRGDEIQINWNLTTTRKPKGLIL